MELHPFKTQKEGLDEYSKHPSFWEAIILDAKVLDESENEVANIGSLYKAVARLQSEFKNVPFFISTGQPDLISAELFDAYCQNTISHRYYEKEVDDELLCNDIIIAIEGKTQRKVKNKYSEVFSWLPSELYGEVLDILTTIEESNSKDTSMFNGVRKILDWVMKELNAYGIFGIEFTGSNLSECSRFLCNSDLQDYVPQYVQRQIHSCCTIANEGSHRETKTHEDVSSGYAPYLVRSTVFELLNILMWYHQLPTDDDTRRKITNIAVNIASKLSKSETPPAKEEPQEPVLDTECNVWHCGDSMIGVKYWDGGKILLFDKQPNLHPNPRVKEKYPYFAKYKKI